MRTWTRNPLKETICGGPCTRPMRKGEPLLEIRIAGRNGGKDIVLKRCASCADEPVPADLPPLAEPEPIVPMAHIRTGVNVLPLDFKMAAAGREPGEDDE